MPVDQAFELLGSAVHEHRLAALLVLVERFVSASRARTRDEDLRAELHARYLVAVSHATGQQLGPRRLATEHLSKPERSALRALRPQDGSTART